MLVPFSALGLLGWGIGWERLGEMGSLRVQNVLLKHSFRKVSSWETASASGMFWLGDLSKFLLLISLASSFSDVSIPPPHKVMALRAQATTTYK